ncbi:MAG: 4-hydroxy-tetrahydrodipicolinate synthase [bacterium]|nr:4-hydroxy-tetrahydrodipicolinate synthase [bacterium]
MFQGAMTAIVTPFKAGKVDEGALQKLIEFQLKNGIKGIIPCGTTGESATLAFAEHKRVVEITVSTVNKRVPVIAGAGSNNTEEALELTKFAKSIGADGALLITPYYNRPTPRGLFMHYEKIAKSVDIPIIIYNVPTRTGTNILPQTVYELSKIQNIVGIKEATGDLKQASEIIKLCGDRFTMLSGDDYTILPFLSIGGHGVISVVANIVPGLVSRLIEEFISGNTKKAKELHYKIFPLTKACFLETNPIPVKTALSMMGMVSPELRLPLCPMTDENINALKLALKANGLIS